MELESMALAGALTKITPCTAVLLSTLVIAKQLWISILGNEGGRVIMFLT